MFGSLWKNNFDASSGRIVQSHLEMTPAQFEAFREKYKYRLMENGGNLLFDLPSLDPNDDDLLELLNLNNQQIDQQARASENPLWHNNPPKGSKLTDEPAIWAGGMSTGDGLPLPTSRSVSGMGIIGPSGLGKTTLAMILAIQLVLAETLVIVWDIKATWRKLLNFPLLAGKIIVLQIHDLMLSLLQPPPGINVNEWGNRFTNVFAQVYGRISSQRILRQVIEKLLAQCPPGVWPTPRMLINYLESLMSTIKTYKEREYIASVLWVLIDMMHHFPHSLEFTSSDFFQKMFSLPGRLIIIEDNGLPVHHWNFPICLSNEWIIAVRRASSHLRQFDILQVLEDSTSLIDPARDRETPGGVSMIAQNLNICREMRVGIVPICHSLGNISPKILPNLESLFVCSLRGEDLRLAQQVLGISQPEAEWLRVNPRGTACALVPSVWPLPVQITFPRLPESI